MIDRIAPLCIFLASVAALVTVIYMPVRSYEEKILRIVIGIFVGLPLVGSLLGVLTGQRTK
jgi:hypothetical protein